MPNAISTTARRTARAKLISQARLAVDLGSPFLPDGSTNAYSYDSLNRLATLANSWAGSFGFSYDALSRRTQMTRPNGVATNYTYDNLSRLLSMPHQLSGSTIDGAV